MAADSATIKMALDKIQQGPTVVEVDPDGDNVPLFLRDGIDIEFVSNFQEVSVDVVGVCDIFTGGDGATFELAIPEESLTVANVLWPEGDTDGTSYRGFGRLAGRSMRDNDAAKFLMRTEADWREGNSTPQLELWQCVPSDNATWSRAIDSSYMFTRQFRALPDLTKSDGQLIGKLSVTIRS